MSRRQFIRLVGGTIVLCPTATFSQPPKRPLIGWLGGATRASGSRQLAGFVRGLKEFGYVEGSTIDIEYRWAEGDLSRQPVLAEQLVQRKPAIILAANSAAALAAKRASAIIPIVCPSLLEPVRQGLVASHSRPGGNVTGILIEVEGMPGKQLELLAELVPGLSRVGMLVNVNA